MLIHTLFTSGQVGALVVLEFLLAASVIVLAGRKLTVLGDAIAEVTGLGRLWIGATLIAAATSLPEIASSATAAFMETDGSINLAFGNVLGSETFNLLLVLIVDALFKNRAFLSYASPNHVLSAITGIGLMAAVAIGVALPKLFPGFPAAGYGGLYSGALSVGIFVFSILALRMIFKHEQATAPPEVTGAADEASKSGSNMPLYGKFAVAAAVVTVGAVWMIGAADGLAVMEMPWGGRLGRSLVGTLLVALATSLPELTVTVSAVKLGAVDIALGNILGSNVLNIFILPLVSLLSWQPIFIDPTVEPVHVPTAVIGILMTIPVIIGLVVKPKKVFMRLGYGTWLMALFYVIGIWLVVKLSQG